MGDVQLSYDAPVLVGQARRAAGRDRALPQLLFLGGLVGCIGALGALVADPGGSIALALCLGASGALSAALGGRLERRVRHRRRFILNFADELVRVDLPGGLWHRPSTNTWHFDEVREVFVEARADGQLRLLMEVGPPGSSDRRRTVLLVDAVQSFEAEPLRRLWTALRAALGVTRLPEEA